MLVCEDGATVGSLSAGCVEEEVALAAKDVVRTGQPNLISFDTRRRFGCAGKIDIFIERANEKFFADLADTLEARVSCVVLTTGNGSLVDLGARFSSDHEMVSKNPDANRGVYSHDKDLLLMQEIHPPIRVLIAGDGLDNDPLGSFGRLLGWDVLEFIDPREISIRADDWTAAIVKSHNYGRDFVALQKLLPLSLRYVGLIGPRKRRDELMNALLDLSITVHAGFFAPAGLDLGAETPEEIALAVIAEIQRVFCGGSGFPLRERKNPIHHPRPLPPQNPLIRNSTE